MRNFILFAGLLAMTACGDSDEIRTTPQAQDPTGGILVRTPAMAQQDTDGSDPAAPMGSRVARTFADICLTNRGDAAATRRSAEARGFTAMDGVDQVGGAGAALANTAIDQWVQINFMTDRAFECAVVTSDSADADALRDEFFALVGARNVAPGQTVTSDLGGETFTFSYETTGGESLVMYR